MEKLKSLEAALGKAVHDNTLQEHGVGNSAACNMGLELKMIEVSKEKHPPFVDLCESLAVEFAPSLIG